MTLLGLIVHQKRLTTTTSMAYVKCPTSFFGAMMPMDWVCSNSTTGM